MNKNLIIFLTFILSYQIGYAQQPLARQMPTEGFVDLEMPLEEALTKITFIVTRLSGEGSREVVSSEVVFEGEGVTREKDYIELRIPHDFGERVAYNIYTLLSKYAVESNRYIFVPFSKWNGSSRSTVFWYFYVVDKKTLRIVDGIRLGGFLRIEDVVLADVFTNTVSITYIRGVSSRGEVVYDPDKAIKRHLRMIEGKFRDVEDPLSPSDPDMMFVRAGTSWMGSHDDDAADDEKHLHIVYLDAFYIDKYEVTNAQYKKFVDTNPRWQKDRIPEKYHDGDYLKHWNGNNYPSGKGNHPVVYVSWYAAMAYAEWRGKRLPTEAEWEKAARGGRHPIKYTWGSSPDLNKANYGGKIGDTTPVGTYEANGYGLYDMAGNVWEWCLDEYNAGFYYISPYRNPVAGGTVDSILSDWTNVKSVRVLRGGSWVSDVQFMVVSDRTRFTPRITNNARGFRCVKPVTRDLATENGKPISKQVAITSQSSGVFFQLVEPIKFANDTVVTSISKTGIDTLWDLPVRLGENEHIDGITIKNEKGEKIHVRTCREYDAALKHGYQPDSTFEIKMSVWFEHQCGLLKALEMATAPHRSYISNPNVGIANLDLLPFAIFPAGRELDATYQEKIENEVIVVRAKNRNHLVTEGKGIRQSLKEVVRADFNNDGIEDILLFEYHHYIKGTLGNGGIIILTRKSMDGKFEAVRPLNPMQD